MKSLKEFWPIISIGIVTVSFFNLAFYYSQFGIPIQNYIDIGEIVFSLVTFFSSIYSISYGILVALVFASSKSKNSKNLESQTEMFETYRASKSRVVRLFFSYFSEKAFLMTIGILVAAAIFSEVVEAGSSNELKISAVRFDFCCMVLIFVLSLVAAAASVPGRAMRDATDTSITVFILSISVLGITFLSVRNKRSADLIKEGIVKYTVTLSSDRGATYRSNDTLRYIGSTKNYCFFYNSSKQSTIIIPIKDVSKFDIKKLREGL